MSINLFQAFGDVGKVAVAVTKGVSRVAKEAGTAKAKFDYFNTDTDNTGLTQAQDIQKSVTTLINRVNGDPELKKPLDDAKAEAERVKKVAAEHTTMKLVEKTKADWQAEYDWYKTETKVASAFIGAAFKNIFESAQREQVALIESGGNVA